MKKLILLLLLASGHLAYAQLGGITLHGVNTATALPGPPIPGWLYTPPTTITRTNNPVTTAQWHFDGQQTALNPTSGALSSDWIYDMVTTRNHETIACGFGNNAAGVHSGTMLKLDHLGNLKWNIALDPSTMTITNLDFNEGSPASVSTESTVPHNGDLWAITKSNDGGYVAVGRGNGIIVVEVDSAGNFLNGTPIDVLPPEYPTYGPALSFPVAAGGFSVAIDPNTNSMNNIIIGAVITDLASGGTGFNGAGILELNYGSRLGASTWDLGYVYYGGDGGHTGNDSSGSSINKILTQSTGAGTYKIYACGEISASGDNHDIPTTNADPNPVALVTFNKDIWLLSMDNTMTSVTSAQYNKSNIFVGGTSGSTGGTDLNTYPSVSYQYTETGPLTARNAVGTTAEIPWLNPATGTNEYSPATQYINFTNNKNAAAYDMTFTSDGVLAVISLVNLIGTNPKGNESSLVGNLVSNSAGSDVPQYSEYVDGDAFLLKINPADLSFAGAKNVGHFSGTDFFMQVKQNREGNYIIAGSTADLYSSFGEGSDYNLSPDPDIYTGKDRAFIVSTDNTFNSTTHLADLWRRSFLAQDVNGEATYGFDDMMCVFAMDTTADGGFVIGGNNSLNGDDYIVTKFAPPYQEQIEDGSTGGGYTTFGGSAVPIIHTITGTETWGSSMNVGSLVEVANGATLTISGSSTVISFAASDQLWDYYNYPTLGSGVINGCGIIVEPGGTLNVTEATLQGISIPASASTPGEHNVWDGIVVEASSTAQGKVNLAGANINDARCGVYVAQNYRTYNQLGLSSIAAGAAKGWSYNTQYNGYRTLGGGILTAGVATSSAPTTFNNCYYGAVFENYAAPNTSSIVGCSFTGDAGGMGDICYYTTSPAGALVPPNTHVSLWQWGELSITGGNTFYCNTAFAGNATIGIQVEGSFVNINSNTFTNLSDGIIGSNNGSLVINSNTFDNNANAIKGAGAGVVIQYNTIKIPQLLTYNGTGITLAGAYNYTVTNNTFDRCSTCGSTYGDIGMVINDGSYVNEIVRSNIFNYVKAGTVALQTNGPSVPYGYTGLQFLCNTYNDSWSGISRYSNIAGFPHTYAGTINNVQGGCTYSGTSLIPTSPAGNQFYMPCGGSPATNRLYDADAFVTQAVTYNSNLEYSIYDPYPCYNSALYTDHSCLTSGSILFTSACPVPATIMPTYITPPCLDCAVISPSATGGVIAGIDYAMASTTDPATLGGLQAELDEQVNDLAQYYAANADNDSAAALLAYFGRYRDALPYYVYAGDYTDAATMYNNLPMVTSDDILYAWEAGLMLNLYSNGLTWFDLDSASADSMLTITQYNSPAGYMAGAITALLGLAPVTWPVPVLDTAYMDSLNTAQDTNQDNQGGGSRMANGGNAGANTNNSNSGQMFTLFPNPSFGSLTATATGSGAFYLYTIEGEQVAAYTVDAGSTALQLPAALASGMYMGVFKPDDGEAKSTVRLVYDPQK